jgi:hypothetical protein
MFTGSFRERQPQSALFAMAITHCKFFRCFIASTAASACLNWLMSSNSWSDCWDNASEETTTARITMPTSRPNIFGLPSLQRKRLPGPWARSSGPEGRFTGLASVPPAASTVRHRQDKPQRAGLSRRAASNHPRGAPEHVSQDWGSCIQIECRADAGWLDSIDTSTRAAFHPASAFRV